MRIIKLSLILIVSFMFFTACDKISAKPTPTQQPVEVDVPNQTRLFTERPLEPIVLNFIKYNPEQKEPVKIKASNMDIVESIGISGGHAYLCKNEDGSLYAAIWAYYDNYFKLFDFETSDTSGINLSETYNVLGHSGVKFSYNTGTTACATKYYAVIDNRPIFLAEANAAVELFLSDKPDKSIISSAAGSLPSFCEIILNDNGIIKKCDIASDAGVSGVSFDITRSVFTIEIDGVSSENYVFQNNMLYPASSVPEIARANMLFPITDFANGYIGYINDKGIQIIKSHENSYKYLYYYPADSARGFFRLSTDDSGRPFLVSSVNNDVYYEMAHEDKSTNTEIAELQKQIALNLDYFDVYSYGRLFRLYSKLNDRKELYIDNEGKTVYEYKADESVGDYTVERRTKTYEPNSYAQYLEFCGVASQDVNKVLKEQALSTVENSKYLCVKQDLSIYGDLIEVKQINENENSTNSIYRYFDLNTFQEFFVSGLLKNGSSVSGTESFTQFGISEYGLIFCSKNSEIFKSYESMAEFIDFEGECYKKLSNYINKLNMLCPLADKSLEYYPEKDYSIRAPQFRTNGNDVFSDINNYYAKQFEDTKSWVQDYMEDDLLNDYIEQDFYAKQLSEDLLHVRIKVEWNGLFNPDRYSQNELWDLRSGERLNLFDIFIETPDQEFLDWLNKVMFSCVFIKDNIDTNEGFLFSEFADENGEPRTDKERAIDHIDFNKDWYLSEEGLVLDFQEYAIGGNGSDFELLIPFDKLKSKIKDRFNF